MGGNLARALAWQLTTTDNSFCGDNEPRACLEEVHLIGGVSKLVAE